MVDLVFSSIEWQALSSLSKLVITDIFNHFFVGLQHKDLQIFLSHATFIKVSQKIRPTRAYVLSSITRSIRSFFKRLFSMYRGIFELKNDISIFCKNGSFANKTCCGLTVLFIKTKINFFRYNFTNKQINKNSQHHSFVQTVFHKVSVVLEMEPQINGKLLKTFLYNVTN